MQKWNFLKASLVITSLVLASNTHAANRENVYFGAGIGANFNQSTLNTSNTITGLSVSNNVNNTKVVGNVFLGYGYTFSNCFYLGAELGTNFPSRSATISNRPGVTLTPFTFTDQLKVQDYITGDLLPGYRFDKNWLVYGRVGLTRSQLSLNQSPNAAAGTPGFNANQTKWGSRFGLGANYAFTDNLGVGLDYYYTNYQNMNAVWPPFNINFTQKASSHFVGLSLIYSIS